MIDFACEHSVRKQISDYQTNLVVKTFLCYMRQTIFSCVGLDLVCSDWHYYVGKYLYFLVLFYILIYIVNCTVIAVDAKEHMHRRQMLAGMLVSNTRLVLSDIWYQSNRYVLMYWVDTERLWTGEIITVMHRNRLRWYGCAVEEMRMIGWKCMDHKMEDVIPKRLPKKTWGKIVDKTAGHDN